ncbi:hypothetical protein AN219_20540 [Streptomyces nanshensis]|nr:hypothetical protein AN219_20540 [Streptomyces nanshensis]
MTALLVRQLAAPQPAPLPPGRRVRRSSEARTWCAALAGPVAAAALAAAAVALVVPEGQRNVPSLPVPKQPYSTLAPERQPGRLRPMVHDGALPARPDGENDGPAPRRYAQGTGPFVVRA